MKLKSYLIMAACLTVALPHYLWAKPLRIMSLDMCADQYVLALVPHDQILGVSFRAKTGDSYYRDRAQDLRPIAPDLETVLALKPDIIVREWGGDFALIHQLKNHGVKIIQINMINDLAEAKNEMIRVGNALDQSQSSLRESQRFNKALADYKPWGQGRHLLYYTPSGFSTGAKSYVGKLIMTMGFKLVGGDKGYYDLSPEAFIQQRPDLYALGFFDDAYNMGRVEGRLLPIQQRIDKTPHFVLPRPSLSCQAWYNLYQLPQHL